MSPAKKKYFGGGESFATSANVRVSCSRLAVLGFFVGWRSPLSRRLHPTTTKENAAPGGAPSLPAAPSPDEGESAGPPPLASVAPASPWSIGGAPSAAAASASVADPWGFWLDPHATAMQTGNARRRRRMNGTA